MPDMETTEKKKITFRPLWRLCPARHAVLLISLAWLAAYFLLRENRAVMNFLCKALVRPWHAFAGRLFSAVPFSVTEWVILFLTALGVVLLVLLIVQLIRRRWAKAYRTGMTILSVSAAMFALFCLWWGVLYYSDSFTEQAGLERRDISVQELETVTRYFAEQANAAGEHVERGEDGVFRADKSDIFRRSPDIYGGAEQIFPCLAAPAVRAKPVLLSRLLSYIRYTGFFFPYTAEANLNADLPACLLPSTIAHELTHLRGVAREDEANFCAVVACMESDDEDTAIPARCLPISISETPSTAPTTTPGARYIPRSARTCAPICARTTTTGRSLKRPRRTCPKRCMNRFCKPTATTAACRATARVSIF